MLLKVGLPLVLVYMGPTWTGRGGRMRREWAHRGGPYGGKVGGNCAPTSGSPVAPSRTCRLFPRRDSRSPHLSSVRPASPYSSLTPLVPASSLTLSPPTAHVCTAGTGQGAGHVYLFLDIFGPPREEIHSTCTRSLSEHDLSISGECHGEGRMEGYSDGEND